MGSGHLQVGASTIAQLENPDYTEWEDDELIRGQKRNSRGHFTGRKPKVVPLALLHELNRRMASEGLRILNASLVPAIQYLADVAEGRKPPDKDRMHACEVVINRILGVAPQRIQIQEVSESPWEKAGVGKAIILREVIDVDSEEDENPFE